MLLKNELMLKYGVKTVDELFSKKTDSDKKTLESPIIKTAKVNISQDKCKKMCDKIGLEYKEGFENRIIERVVTTEAPDRDGDIVRAAGVSHKNYAKNPVVLFAHNKSSLPVGNSIKWWQDGNINGVKGWRSYDLYFNDEIDKSGMSDIVFRFVVTGAMPGGSIGFTVQDAKFDHTPEEREKIGLGTWGVEFLKIDKLEHSVCSVPSNQDALARHLKSIDRTMLLDNFSKGDADVLAKEKAIDENLIDVFSSVLFGEKTISVPEIKVPDTDTTVEDEDDGDVDGVLLKTPEPQIVVNISVDKAYEELCKLTESIKVFDEKFETIKSDINETVQKIKDVEKSFSEKCNSILTIVEKLASNRGKHQPGLYDNDSSVDDLKGILKL